MGYCMTFTHLTNKVTKVPLRREPKRCCVQLAATAAGVAAGQEGRHEVIEEANPRADG